MNQRPVEPQHSPEGQRRLDKKLYESELKRLQLELVKLQEWVRREGQRVVVLFEGRDAAGKGGIIKRIVDPCSHRIVRVAALANARQSFGAKHTLPGGRGPMKAWHYQTVMPRIATTATRTIPDSRISPG